MIVIAVIARKLNIKNIVREDEMKIYVWKNNETQDLVE